LLFSVAELDHTALLTFHFLHHLYPWVVLRANEAQSVRPRTVGLVIGPRRLLDSQRIRQSERWFHHDLQDGLVARIARQQVANHHGVRGEPPGRKESFLGREASV